MGLTTFAPSCADCLEICEPHPPGMLKVCRGLEWDFLVYERHSNGNSSVEEEFRCKFNPDLEGSCEYSD